MRLAGKDVGDLGVPDPIDVAFRLRREAAVKVAGDGLDGGDTDVVRQEVVESLAKAARLDSERDVGMCPLRPCVDAGVGSSGGVDPYRLPGDRRDRPLELTLDGPALPLDLEPGEVGAVVLQGEFDVVNDYSTSAMIAIAAPSPRRGGSLTTRV